MTIEEQIRQRRMEIQNAVSDNIIKGFDVDIEKAKHQDGDMHPNGKWVWVSSANGGKGDWRTKGGRTHTKHSAGGNASNNSENKEQNGNVEKLDSYASKAPTSALKRAAEDDNASKEVRDAANKELNKRNKQGETDETKSDSKEMSSNNQSETKSSETKQGETRVLNKHLNTQFANSIPKRDLNRIAKESGIKGAVKGVGVSNDGKGLRILHYENGIMKNTEVPLDSPSETLQNLYSNYSNEISDIVNNENPSSLDNKTLKKHISIEIDNFLGNSNANNDSSDYREGMYQIYQKYKKNNPMSVDKFDREFSSNNHGASQGVKMKNYFLARDSGATDEEAENYAQTEFEALKKHLDDPVMRNSRFEPRPFTKSYIQEIEKADLISQIHIDSIQEAEDILKAAGTEELFEKARSGIYADNAENRRLMRVGQKYGEISNTFRPGNKVKVTLPTDTTKTKPKKRPIGVGTNGPEKRTSNKIKKY